MSSIPDSEVSGGEVPENGVSDAGIAHPISLGSAEFTADPPAHFAWLRANAPVYRGRVASWVDQDVWLLSRYEDCKALLTDERFPRSPEGGSAMTEEMPEHLRLFTSASLLYTDDPEHRRLRKLVAKPFTLRAIERLGERVGELADELLDELEARGRAELRREFALPLPMTIISEMVGVPASQRKRFHHGIEALFGGPAENGQQAWEDEVKALVDLVRELIEQRRNSPGEDILTGLIQAEEDGDRLEGEELTAMVFTLVTAGYETTYNLITNAVVTLLDHPEQLARLRDDPGLLPGAIEEILRYAGPVQGTEALTAAEDVTWHGRTIPAGSLVLPLLGSANRDPDAFEDPEAFDVSREPNRHLGFGHGAHFCLGANLARLETRIALEKLLRRNPGLALDVERDELVVEQVPLFVRYRELPVRLGH
ncbi:cytochrome P450 family protein [Actinopolyspora sp. H202]|uniref:cytochrome P450 family protein n=1 Tax=Actinopolyspora sp. H202 TaxID=1500456 RepID=UPI003EE5F2DD